MSEFRVIIGHLEDGVFVEGPAPEVEFEDDKFENELKHLREEEDEPKFDAKDLLFDIALVKSTWGGKKKVLAVFISDDSGDRDDLGNHNVNGLPSYFPDEASECYWELERTDLDVVKADMIAAGFTYQKMDDWHE